MPVCVCVRLTHLISKYRSIPLCQRESRPCEQDPGGTHSLSSHVQRRSRWNQRRHAHTHTHTHTQRHTQLQQKQIKWVIILLICARCFAISVLQPCQSVYVAPCYLRGNIYHCAGTWVPLYNPSVDFSVSNVHQSYKLLHFLLNLI